MGTTRVYVFEEKKWKSIDNSNINGDFCNQNHLYSKYFSKLPKEQNLYRESIVPLKHYLEFSTLQILPEVKWYERLCFKISKEMCYFNSDDIPVVIKALELMNEDLTENNGYKFNTQMIAFLKELKFSDNKAIALGYSSGGFWGTDGDYILESISTELDDAARDEIWDNTNLSPYVFGDNLCLGLNK